jgi:hypothetical protein
MAIVGNSKPKIWRPDRLYSKLIVKILAQQADFPNVPPSAACEKFPEGITAPFDGVPYRSGFY